MAADYDGLRFTPAGGGATIGHYHQDGDLVWAEFAGHDVRSGRLVGTCDAAGVLDVAYCQVLSSGEVVGGRMVSTPSTLADGRLRLAEHWRRHDGSSGVSYIEEVAR